MMDRERRRFWRGGGILLAAACLCRPLFPRPLAAAFEDFGLGARAAGVSGAFTAVSDDISALEYNPAGLAQQHRLQIGSGLLRLFQQPAGVVNLSDTSLAIVYPTEDLRSSWGASWRSFTEKDFARNRAVQLGYGLNVHRSLHHRVDLGLSASVMSRSALRSSSRITSVGADAGAMWEIDQKYVLGFSVLNANKPSLSLAGIDDSAPPTFKLGLAERVRGFLLSLDYTQRLASANNPSSYTYALGMERWLSTARFGSYAFRAGMGLGNRTDQVTLGAGIHFYGAQLDYALLVPASGQHIAGHALSLILRFGEKDPEAEYEQLLNQEIEARRELAALLEFTEKQLSAIKEDLSLSQKELQSLKDQLQAKDQEAESFRGKIDALINRQKEVAQEVRAIQVNKEKLKRERTENIFEEDWEAYKALRTAGKSKAELKAHLEGMLKRFRGQEVDLSPVNQEIFNLLQSR